MATLYITEFADAGISGKGESLPIGAELAVEDMTVAISGSSAQSDFFENNTRLVRLHTDAICSVLFGVNPTATTGNRRMAANQTEYFSVPTGSGWKVAVISNT